MTSSKDRFKPRNEINVNLKFLKRLLSKETFAKLKSKKVL